MHSHQVLRWFCHCYFPDKLSRGYQSPASPRLPSKYPSNALEVVKKMQPTLSYSAHLFFFFLSFFFLGGGGGIEFTHDVTLGQEL